MDNRPRLRDITLPRVRYSVHVRYAGDGVAAERELAAVVRGRSNVSCDSIVDAD